MTVRETGFFGGLEHWLMHVVDACKTVTENPTPALECDLGAALYLGR